VLAASSLAATTACSDAASSGGQPGGDPDGTGSTGGGKDAAVGWGGSDAGATTDTGTGPGPGEDDGTAGPGDAGSVDFDTTAPPDVTGPTGPGVGGKEFPSGELGISIIGPSAADSVAVQNAVVSINGLVFGEADTITITCSCGPAVEGAGSPYWGSPPLSLSTGDNEITVTATGPDGQVATDSIRITYNPLFDFDGPPVARPASLWVGEKTELFFTIPISLYPNFDPASVELVQVDTLGNQLATWKMADTGNFESAGDEVPKDGVFSARLSVTHPTPETLWFRVRVKVIPADGGAPFSAWSDVVTIDAVEHFTVAQCQAVQGAVAAAQAAFDGAYAQGIEPAQQAALAALQGNATVTATGTSPAGNGVWAAFDSGVLASVEASDPGTRSGGGGAPSGGYTTTTEAFAGALPIQSRDVLVLSPYAQELSGLDETPQIATLLRDSVCPAFSVLERQGDAANLAQFKSMNQKGIVALATHGDVLFGELSDDMKARFRWDHEGSQELLWTGEAIDCNALLQAPKTCNNSSNGCGSNGECIYTAAQGTTATGYCLDHTQVDIKMGRVVLGGGGTYGVTPSFFTHHATKKAYPDSLVYIGACSSMWNGSLARALYGAGARGIAGFSGVVSSAFAMDRGQSFFDNMITGTMEAGSAAVSLEDPDHEGSFFRLFGASNLDVNGSDIINPDYEKGSAIGWSIEGDGRVISQFGITLPVLGKFMGIISTGMGYTLQTGELKQTFCIPQGKTQFTFYWKFFSEEFTEWCGSEYQDTFQASLQGDQGKIVLVDTKVDDICPANACFGCGSQALPLVPSDVSFDQGDVYNTQWQQATSNISALAGAGPVILKFFATDAGDSIYDTVILVDSLKFE
jgi:hypothetical protein